MQKIKNDDAENKIENDDEEKRKDDEDSGEIDKLSSVGSELIVSEILLATARKCTAENDHDDEVKYTYLGQKI